MQFKKVMLFLFLFSSFSYSSDFSETLKLMVNLKQPLMVKLLIDAGATVDIDMLNSAAKECEDPSRDVRDRHYEVFRILNYYPDYLKIENDDNKRISFEEYLEFLNK